MPTSELAFLSATALADRLHRREIGAVEVLDACAAQYEHINPAVNAIVTPYSTGAAQARQADERLLRRDDVGPLHGLPWA